MVVGEIYGAVCHAVVDYMHSEQCMVENNNGEACRKT